MPPLTKYSLTVKHSKIWYFCREMLQFVLWAKKMAERKLRADSAFLSCSVMDKNITSLCHERHLTPDDNLFE